MKSNIKFIQGGNAFWNLDRISYIAYNKIDESWVVTAETIDGDDIDLAEVRDEYNLGDSAMKQAIEEGIVVALVSAGQSGVGKLEQMIMYRIKNDQGFKNDRTF